MVKGRDDFIIAVRSAFLKKKDKQRFSLLTLIFLSLFIIILDNFNFKIIQVVQSGIKDFIYRTSSLLSVPENKIRKIRIEFNNHIDLLDKYEKNLLELKDLKQKKLSNNYLISENKKLKNLINESVSSNEILSKVLIDQDSRYLKSIVVNKGSKDNIKNGMVVIDGVYLVGKIVEVNYSNSRVLLLSDLNSKIPVRLEPVGIQAIISGSGKDFGEIEFAKEEYKNKMKDKKIIVYTSGLGGVYKPGIPVGKISNNQINTINFFSDFYQLDYVKIVSYKFEGQN
ncbi:rod shape-determining protein MreC [Candidatus Pelagibacter sp.]|nr:rod shape-determining protein MreC [Candidatus Pelagibacter sp.]